jgi:hypothetical protein
MRGLIAATLAFTLLGSSFVLGQDSAAKTKAAKKAAKPAISKNYKDIETHVDLLQQQVDLLKQQLARRDQQLDAAQQQLQNAVEQVKAEQQQLAATQQRVSDDESSVNALRGDVTTLKFDTSTLTTSLKEKQQAISDLQNPVSIHYRGLTLTPGGYVTLDGVARSRNENADTTSNFGAIPFGGTANSKLSEFHFSARTSRLSLLAQGAKGSTKLTAYYEMDFFAAPPSASYVSSNSFSPRERQLFGQVDLSNGLTLTGGQFWSLVTTNRRGIATRQEFIPNVLEASYLPGYDWVRQPAFRVTKNFNNRTWAAFEIANSETTLATSFTPANLLGFNNSANALSPSGGTLNFLAGSAYGLSTNIAPDLLAKVAFDPGWGHYEIKALGRFFRDRISGDTNTTVGGGLGAAAIFPITHKIDFLVQGLVGNGIGRYGSGQGPDVTVKPDGTIVPVRAYHVMGAIEANPTPKLFAYVYGGNEYYSRTSYISPTGGPAGYGSSLVNNTSCGLEVVPASAPACGAQNRDLWDITPGFWYKLYQGPYGSLQYGMEYEYINRSTWAGVGGAPKGIENIGFVSFRFLLP